MPVEAVRTEPNLKKIVVEGLHAYFKDGVTYNEGDLEAELKLLANIRKNLEAQDYTITEQVLLDDTRPRAEQSMSIDSWRWELFIQRFLTARTEQLLPQFEILSEHDYITRGKAIITTLQHILDAEDHGFSDTRLAGAKKDRIKIGTKSTGSEIMLTQKIRGGPEQAETAVIPSCPVLDTAVYQEKLLRAGAAITVLPHYFKSQQDEVHTLFTLLRIPEPNILILYVDPDTHKVTASEAWNPDLTSLAAELQESLAE